MSQQQFIRANNIFVHSNGNDMVVTLTTSDTNAIASTYNNDPPIVCILLDTSGSMQNKNKLQISLQFIANMVTAAHNDSLFTLVTFSDNPKVIIDGKSKSVFLQTFTMIRSVINAYGQTYIMPAIRFALEKIGSQLNFYQKTNAVLVEITDGQGNSSEDCVMQHEHVESNLDKNLSEAFKRFNSYYTNKKLDCVFIEPTCIEDTAPVDEYVKFARIFQRVLLTGNRKTDLAEIAMMNSVISDCITITPKLLNCNIAWNPSIDVNGDKIEIWDVY